MSDDNQQEQKDGGPLDQARDVAEQQIGNIIDNFAAKIPGGSQYTEQAKDAVDGVLDKMQDEGEKRMENFDLGSTLGGFLGGNKKDQ